MSEQNNFSVGLTAFWWCWRSNPEPPRLTLPSARQDATSSVKGLILTSWFSAVIYRTLVCDFQSVPSFQHPGKLGTVENVISAVDRQVDQKLGITFGYTRS
uniref:Uncharacterized protein n=1 Tax=Mus musculus TaxID=10090 RepID=Q9D9E3_MOUSE|nr:unnamed protein product [Mus musculus]